MTFKSRWSSPPLVTSLPSYLFDSQAGPISTAPVLLDAARPDTHHLTLTTYREWSKRFAAGLRAAGLQKGDRVMFFSGNKLFCPVIVMGIAMAGGIFTGANPTYMARELAHQLRDAGPRFFLVAPESMETGLEAAKMVGYPKNSIFTFDDAVHDDQGTGVMGTEYWDRLIASPEEGAKFRWEELSTRDAADRTVALNYSSGTTGLSKGVEISHFNYVANCSQVSQVAELDPEYPQKRETARWLCYLPLYHAFGQTYFVISGPKAGVPSYVMPRFDFLSMLEYVQKYRITDLLLVPPIAVALAKHPSTRDGTFDLSSVRSVSCGAAPLGKEVGEEVNELWKGGQVNLKQGWGMTEVTCSGTSWDPRERPVPGSVGDLLPNVEAKIIDTDGVTELGLNQRGEIWVRAPNVMKGYWNNPKATHETLTEDRWLKTGDIAYFNDDRKLFVVDRVKELIKVKGNQVAPAELEAVLLEHPEVTDAAVIGMTIDSEEYPRAYIIPREGSAVTAEDIVKYMDERVSKLKRITGGVVFTDVIPKNPSGKILRKILREQSKTDTAAAVSAAATQPSKPQSRASKL